MTIVYAVGLMVLLAFVEGMEESEVFGFLIPYEQYISVGLVVLMGHLPYRPEPSLCSPALRGERRQTLPERCES